ncbi:MAG: divalent-cation tolerance protein CutA [Alphaproteobacteria bacterium]
MAPMTKSDARLVYITTDGPEEARKIGRALVEERLAACANIVHPMTSVFRWEGEIREAAETVLIAKTTADKVEALTERVLALHSYECPCVAAIPIDGGNPAFMDWIADETAE